MTDHHPKDGDLIERAEHAATYPDVKPIQARLVTELVETLKATRQNSGEWQALYEEERGKVEEAQRSLILMTGQRDRLRQGILDIGVQPDIVDLIQNFGAKINIERTPESPEDLEP